MGKRRILNPVAYAIEGASKLPRDQVQRIVVGNARSFTALRAGTATCEDFDHLTQAVLMADDLRRFRLASNHKATFATAIDALAAILTRSLARTCPGSTPHYIATGPELSAIELCIRVHRVQVEEVSVREMESAVTRLQAQWMQRRRSSAQAALRPLENRSHGDQAA